MGNLEAWDFIEMLLLRCIVSEFLPSLLVFLHFFIMVYWNALCNWKLQKVSWWLPQHFHSKRSRHSWTTCGFSGLIQFSSSDFWADSCHLCPAKTVCCVIYSCASVFPNRNFWENGGWRGYRHCFYFGQAVVKHTNFKRRTNKFGYIRHSCLAGVLLVELLSTIVSRCVFGWMHVICDFEWNVFRKIDLELSVIFFILTQKLRFIIGSQTEIWSQHQLYTTKRNIHILFLNSTLIVSP